MIRLIFIMHALFISRACCCQVNPGSPAGSYAFKKSMGGGFTGGPNGECMAAPPDYRVTHKLSIRPDLRVSKTSDTTWYSGNMNMNIRIGPGCDTLCIGKAKMRADTLVITYTLKPICSGLFYDRQAGKHKRYEKLKQPVTEKFIIIREANNRISELRKWNDEWEVYEKERPDDTKQ